MRGQWPVYAVFLTIITGASERQVPQLLQDGREAAAAGEGDEADAAGEVREAGVGTSPDHSSNPLAVKPDTRAALGLASFPASDNPLPRTSYVPQCFFDKVA